MIDQLRKIRKQYNLNQTQFGALCEPPIKQPQIALYEKHSDRPHAQVRKRIESAIEKLESKANAK